MTRELLSSVLFLCGLAGALASPASADTPGCSLPGRIVDEVIEGFRDRTGDGLWWLISRQVPDVAVHSEASGIGAR